MTRKNKRKPFAVLAFVIAGIATTAQADWLAQVCSWLRLDRTPSEMRAAGDTLQDGEIFVVSLDGGEPQAVTSGGGFRSPVFLPDGETLLALHGSDLISLPASGGTSQKLYTVQDAVKLLGVNSENNNLLLLLLKKADGGIELGELELDNGQIKRLPNDPSNPDHRLMLRRLRGDDRDYEGMSIYLQTESKARLGGQVEWTDIYVKQGGQAPANISRCAGANCSQPAVSSNGSRLVFIKSNENY